MEQRRRSPNNGLPIPMNEPSRLASHFQALAPGAIFQ